MTPVSTDDLVSELAGLLVRSLRLLYQAGATDPACEIAALGWRATHRAGHPAAQRFDGVLHHLTRPTTNGGQAVIDSRHVLDVRQEIPARRHDLIFRTYAELPAGDGFVLINDHDPKPLYYQLAAEHPNEFEWDYLEQGPQVWRVRIGRPAA